MAKSRMSRPLARYRVLIVEEAVYECEISARSKSEAEYKATVLFLGPKGISVAPPFSCTVNEREVTAAKLDD